MIALIDELPLVEFDKGQVFIFQREWLRKNLVQAAERAGYRDWWLAEHITQSVVKYLISEYESTVLAAAELKTSVAEVLVAIGYSEIAGQYFPTRPPRDISLLELAREADRHEMTFFSLLRQAINHEMQQHATGLCLIHLPPAVKLLLGVKLFTEECACLRQEIVAFSQAIVTPFSQSSPIGLLIR